jgi:hypothetical protein
MWKVHSSLRGKCKNFQIILISFGGTAMLFDSLVLQGVKCKAAGYSG